VDKVIEITNAVYTAMNKLSKIRVTSKKGTDISFDVTDRKVIPSTGVLRNIGEGGNIPSGEVYLAPVEGSANGMIVFDGSIAGIGILSHPVYIEIENGIATKISGKGGEARLFGRMINRYENDSKSIGEFGIGTNPFAKICGEILEDEKVLGTVHFAFGNNLSMGGTINVPLHIDGLINKPTVYFNDKKVMEDGKLLIVH
jgi:leucyl aminopeptidase (aminopeptidase T)